MGNENEEKRLRAAALQSAQNVLLAGQRAEHELIAANEALKQKTNELARSLDELRQQREWFEVTLSSIGDAVITTDVEAKVTFLNPAAEKMTGWSLREAVGQPLTTVFNIINERTRQPAQNPVTTVLRDGVAVGLANHTALISRDGSETAIEDSAAPIRDATGKISGAVMVFHDVTERRRSEEALRASEQRMRTFFNQAAVGIAIAGLNGQFLELNQRFSEILGYTFDELRGLTFIALTHPDDLRATEEHVRQLLGGKTSEYVMEKRYRRKDGGIVWSLTTVTLLKDSEGAPRHFIGVIEDITPRKIAENELRDARTRLEATLNAAEIGTWSWDIPCNRVTADKNLARMFGVAAEDANGGPIERYLEAVHPGDREKVRQAIETSIQSESGDYQIEYRLLTKEGAVRWGIARGKTQRGTDGKPAQLSGAIIDITERKLAEEAARTNAQRLQLAISAGQMGDWSWDAATDIVILGNRAAEIFGLVPGTPTTWADLRNLLLEEDRERARLAVEQALRLHNDYNIEYGVIRPSGERGWILAQGRGLYGDNGDVIGMIGVVQDITARRRADAELRSRERELSLIFSSVSDIIFYLAIEGEGQYRFISVNPAFLITTGLTQQQVVGKLVQEVIPEPSCSYVIDKYRTAIQEKSTVRWEETSVYPAGRKVGAVSITPVFDAQDRCINLIGTVHDVTERKKSEEALKDETRILELLNRTGTAIASKLDLQTLVQTVTDAGTELSGARFGAFFYNVINAQGESFLLYTLSGAPREAFERFGLPRNTAVFNPTFQGEGVMRSGDITQDPRYGKMAPHHGMPKGHLPVRSYLAVPVISRSGEVIGGLFFGHPEPNVFTERTERIIVGVAAQAAIAIDNARLYEAAQKQITERLTAEHKLRESETRLRISIEATALGTWVFDPATGHVSLDERCRELFGLPAQAETAYSTLLEVVHSEDRPRLAASLQAALSRAGRYEIEYRTAPSSGQTTRWLRGTGKAFFNESGQATRLIGAVLDITDVVKARETMAERREELERLVAERTASLQEAIGQMEEFSYSVSHDLRSPLRTIQGYAEVLLEDYGKKMDEEGRSYLQRIVSAGARMDRLTQDVLRYSKISRTPAEPERVSLDRLVEETVQHYLPEQLAKGQIKVERPLLDVLGHEPSLGQAISNLLGNAVKFVREGEPPMVRIWTEPRDGEVRLWVEDNGIGIEREHQSRVWGMFERIHPKGYYEGTGIGLAIVRKAVERMGGTVGLESDGATGTKFWIQLPAPKPGKPAPSSLEG